MFTSASQDRDPDGCTAAELALRRLAAGLVPGSDATAVLGRPDGLGAGTTALLAFAALVAIGASAAAYRTVVRAALKEGTGAADVIGILIGVAPVVGMARFVAAATSVSLALGYDVDAELERGP